MRFVALAFAVLVLGGCAAQPMYNWGGYESMLYKGYKDPAKMEEMKVGLEKHIAAMDKTGQKIAPGLLAELGTLYLQSGSSDKAVAMYTRERDTWPESKGLMDAMIKNLERRKQASAEVAQ
ncbi:DUF4810 domain-containing protein [Sulfuriferula sp. AH1]|uniref:DUF4810 domain-containing protein n=1 Tax=Sulfuriferula sp. AH1 TaxID=1985873 RepID=UPI000B3B42BF|nr:DUF4810 domain-containing protein [Sulfuriferula sp. AH1]ARU30339.1 DUF4810 domain-containing protein [Sulfuriferula sp. AH1]